MDLDDEAILFMIVAITVIYQGIISGKVNEFQSIVKGKVIRYEMDNLLALNFILEDSLGGGGSESLLNDSQGKTHGQALLLMEVDIPDKLFNAVSS